MTFFIREFSRTPDVFNPACITQHNCVCMNELFIPLHFLKLFPLICWIYPLTWSLRSIKEYLGPSEKRSRWSLIFFWRGIKQVWKINCVITIEWCWNLAVSCRVTVRMAWWFNPLVRDAAYLHGYRCPPLPCHPQTIACQAALSMGFSRPEHWSG